MSWALPQNGSTIATRRAPFSHRPWVPVPYMVRAYEHLKTHRAAGLALRPGMRKTSIALKAFCDLQCAGSVRRMLVIAPLRVCRTVWRQEGAKWTEFRHLRFSLLHGSKKLEALKTEADVYLINPEGVEWLCALFFGRSLPFDIVCIDELTKFKNHQSVRSKTLRPRLKNMPWIWGLTGSLMPNYFMDLFGQQLILDGGAALGHYITHYRDQFFQSDYDGFGYTLLPGSERRITERIAPYWVQLEAADYMTLPEIVPNPIMLDLAKPERALYEKMKRDMIAELPGGVVTAANAAASYSKLAQMANGAVYLSDRRVEHLHDVKLDALDDLVEELAGEPLLVGYEFNHDLTRLQEWHVKRYSKPLPFLGNGTTPAQEADNIAAWNRNEIPVMACHPASAGHGLNLQEGNAHNLAWFGITWDFELYDQFIRRLCRSGNKATHLFEHRFIVNGTIDELKLKALSDKDATQTRFLRALNAEILRSGTDTHDAGETAPIDDRRLPVVQRLSRQAAAAPTATPLPVPAGWGQKPQQHAEQPAAAPTATPPPVPAGWGQKTQQHAEQPAAAPTATSSPVPAGWGQKTQQAAATEPSSVSQQQRIQDQINPQPLLAAAFSGAVQEAHAAAAAFDPTVPPTAAPAVTAPPTSRKRRSAVDTPAETYEAVPSDPRETALIAARAAVLSVAFSDPQTTVDEGLEIARELMAFVVDG